MLTRTEILERVIEFMAQDGEVGLVAMYEMMFAPTKTYPLGYLAEDHEKVVVLRDWSTSLLVGEER